MERFIKEYANHQKSIIIHNDLIKQDIKVRALEKIDKALRLREREVITADEAIRTILEPFEK